MPARIQRRRAKGWRMPDGAVYVGRPGKFGNPWKVGDVLPSGAVVDRAVAVALYAAHLAANPGLVTAARAELADATALACWCPLDRPCHADILIKAFTALPQQAQKQGRLA